MEYFLFQSIFCKEDVYRHLEISHSLRGIVCSGRNLAGFIIKDNGTPFCFLIGDAVYEPVIEDVSAPVLQLAFY